jgi:hypothetical protein
MVRALAFVGVRSAGVNHADFTQALSLIGSSILPASTTKSAG